MNTILQKFLPFLKRTFKTNALTTIGGLLCLLAVGLLVKKLIDQTTMLEMLGVGGSIIGVAGKDGVRTDVQVAPESLDAPDVASPGPGGSTTPAVLLLLFSALCAVGGCASEMRYSSIEPHALALASSHTIPGANYNAWLEATPDSIDLPPAPAGLPPMTKRQARQYRRAERRAVKIAARRPATKIKLKGGSAYAAPDGVAVARPSAPVVVGDSSTATDNRNVGQHANGGVSSGPKAGPATGASVPPEPGFWEGLESKISKILGSVIVVVTVCLAVAGVGLLATKGYAAGRFVIGLFRG